MTVLGRTATSIMLLAAIAVAGGHAQAPAKAYATDFGMSSPIVATGNQVLAAYYGWEATTVFGHEIFALTTGEYQADLIAECFNFYEVFRAGCRGPGNVDFGALQGMALFGKQALGVSCPNPAGPCLGSPIPVLFGWAPGTEVIFALMVNQGENDFNWFFSGDPTRNVDGFAHLAYFPPDLYPDGVPGDDGIGVVPQTAGKYQFAFEDVNYADSDWDFDNAIFGIDQNSIGTPEAVVPEPATLTLLGTGLTTLGLLGRYRRRGRLRHA